MAQTAQKNRVAICCVFMITAAAASFACPFSDAAGIFEQSEISSTGNMMVVSDYDFAQSTGVLGDSAPGQQTLTGGSRVRLMSSPGDNKFFGQSVLDANDYQKYQGVTQSKVGGGGIVGDTAYLASLTTDIIAADPLVMAEAVSAPSVNVTGKNETNVTTIPPVQVQLPFPITESVSVEKGIFGGTGEYRGEIQIEQGSNTSTDFLTLNARSRGNGTYISNIQGEARVSFNPYDNDPNYQISTRRQEFVSNHDVRDLFTWESFSDVFKNPAVNNSTGAS